jgi:hypothetical protein
VPYSMVSERERFTLEMDAERGQPLASVERFGDGVWVTCCPLCGCIHDVTGSGLPQAITPDCISAPGIYRKIRAEWLKLHPEAADYHTIYVTYRGSNTMAGAPAVESQTHAR